LSFFVPDSIRTTAVLTPAEVGSNSISNSLVSPFFSFLILPTSLKSSEFSFDILILTPFSKSKFLMEKVWLRNPEIGVSS